MKISRDCPRHSCVSKSFDWINVVEADHHYFRSTAAELDLREDSIPDTDGMPATAHAGTQLQCLCMDCHNFCGNLCDSLAKCNISFTFPTLLASDKSCIFAIYHTYRF